MDLVDLKVIQKAEKQFEKLDINGDGELSLLDVQMPQTTRLGSRRRRTRQRLSISHNHESYNDDPQETSDNDQQQRQVRKKKKRISFFADLGEHMESFDPSVSVRGGRSRSQSSGSRSRSQSSGSRSQSSGYFNSKILEVDEEDEEQEKKRCFSVSEW